LIMLFNKNALFCICYHLFYSVFVIAFFILVLVCLSDQLFYYLFRSLISMNILLSEPSLL